MKRIDMSNVKEAGDNTRLTAGGYICKYTKVEDREDKEYLYMEFDIVEGEFKGYFKDLSDRFGFWGGKCYRSYKEAAKPMFKRMCSAVSKSNGNVIFNSYIKDDANNKKTVDIACSDTYQRYSATDQLQNSGYLVENW